MTPTVWALIALVIAVTTAGPAIIIWVARRASRNQQQEAKHERDTDTL